MKLLTSVLTFLLITLPLTTSHTVQLNPHSKECFHETLHKGDRMTISFVVGDREFHGAGNLEIDFWVLDPDTNLLTSEHTVSQGDHSFSALLDGKYVYCFSNEAHSVATKEVSFNVHGIVYVPEPPPGSTPPDPLEAEVKRLSDLLAQVKDEQSYIVIRERIHRNTAESTNSRVKWWSIFQLGIVAANAAWQVWWIKRFFEVKRVV